MHKSTSWSLYYEEGLSISWEFSYNQNQLDIFGKLIKDENPLHVDPDFARKKGYEDTVVYGMLISSQISRLIGEELPDKNAILTGLNIDFYEPTYIDQTLNFNAVLDFKSEATKALIFKFEIKSDTKLHSKGKVNAIWRD